jgi:cyclic lactone autoinducer peptide
MKKLKTLSNKLWALIPAFAMVVGVMAINSACAYTYYQSEIPASLDQYRK